MRLIDADALKIKVEAMVEHKVLESDYDYGCNQTLDYVADILIEDAPTVDAAEVVRCKDCKLKNDIEQCPYLQLYKTIDDNGYCSCGERKDK